MATPDPTDTQSIQPPHRERAIVLHVARVALFCLVIWLIHDQHRWYQAQQQGNTKTAITLERVKMHFPNATTLSDWNPSHGGRDVLTSEGEPLGFVIQTSPKSDSIVGFSGPTNTLIAFDTDHRIRSIEVLRSGDTKEHLADVVANEQFMTTFEGLSWKDARNLLDIDAVSGATLTSLAIAEGIIHRLGGAETTYRPSAKESHRFPNPPHLDEVTALFPEAVAMAETEQSPREWHVTNTEGVMLGTVLRTAPMADQIIGYQGPTDALIALDPQRRITGIALRRSYDNEPYVQYVRDETAFLELFNGKALKDLGPTLLDDVEGVSGATMTSTAVAEGVIKAASDYESARLAAMHAAASTGLGFTPRARDIGTISVILVALLIAFTPLKKSRALRAVFQLILIVYLGFINGDMVSQSLLVGWSQSGVPYRFAPGLMLLVAAALLIPMTTKKQLYCHELCPHGALQELIKNRIPGGNNRNRQLPRRLVRALELIPVALLIWVIVVAMLHLPFSLVGIEPFDAYIIRIAGWATIIVAAVGLIASLFVPMAYCRFGCPTGALLKFLRFSGASDRFHKRDAAAFVVVVLAIVLRFAR